MKEKNYNWRNCQDKMFNLRKGELFILGNKIEKSISGCQDPWNVNPNVPLEACTNITHIRWPEIYDLLLNTNNISEAHTTEGQPRWAGMSRSGAGPTWRRELWRPRGVMAWSAPPPAPRCSTRPQSPAWRATSGSRSTYQSLLRGLKVIPFNYLFNPGLHLLSTVILKANRNGHMRSN